MLACLFVAAFPAHALCADGQSDGRGAVEASTTAAAGDVSASSAVFVWSSSVPLTMEAVLGQFELFDRELTSLSAHFLQSLTVTETGMTSAIEGTVEYAKPEKLRIEHVRPERQTVVSDGKDIWIHRHSQSQVVQSNLKDWKKSDPMINNLMQFGSYAKMMRTYDVTLDSAAARPSLSLRPKGEAADFELRFELDPGTLFPLRTELIVQAMRVRTTMDTVAFNPRLKEERFVFEIPADADVFRNFKPLKLDQ